MLSSFASNPFFGLALTFACWALGLKIQKKTGLLLLNPVLVAAVLIVVVLTVFGISFKQYNVGGSLVSLMLGPATAVLALNIYQQREILHKNFLSVVIGCTVGCLVSIGAAILLCRLFGTNQVFSISMLPKSVTTAIALGISESGGGIPGITAAAVVFTGIEGAVIVPWLAKLFRITHSGSGRGGHRGLQPCHRHQQGPGNRQGPGGHEFYFPVCLRHFDHGADAVFWLKPAISVG